jgi:hypothetical protein
VTLLPPACPLEPYITEQITELSSHAKHLLGWRQ